MLGGLGAALAIILFVTAHEAGHFLAAKAVGMKATQFFFGFGPKLWSVQKGETEYGFKLLPLGGYVRIIGMNPLEDVAPEDMGRTYREKKFWEKSVVVLAGVGMNFLIGFLLFWGIVVSAGVPGDPVPEIAAVVEDSPAAGAGLMEGDRIVGLNGQEVETWKQTTDALAEAGPGEATLTIRRGGDLMTLDVVLEESPRVDGAGYLGVAPLAEIVQVGPFESIGIAGQMVGSAVTDTFEALFQMVRPSSLAQYLGVLGGDTDIPDEVRPVSPIGIVRRRRTSPSWWGSWPTSISSWRPSTSCHSSRSTVGTSLSPYTRR